MAQAPNIVFVMADQLGACQLGAYGSGVPSSPTLDRLAASGTRFSRLYASVPVCGPSRASFLTGRSPAQHGVTTNNLELTASSPTYAQALQTVGYRVGGFGKFHQTSMGRPPPENVAYLGFDESVVTEDPKQGAWLGWVRQNHPEHFEAALATSWPVPYLTAEERSAWQRAFDRVLEPRRQASRWPLMYSSPLPAELHQTTYITDLGLDFMGRHLKDHPERPFFLHLSYVDPHDPYDPPAPYDAFFAPDAMPDPLPRRWRGSSVLEKKRAFAGFGHIAGDAAAVRQLRALFHGSVRLIDDQLGRVVRFLDERGLWGNTVVLFTTDHGELLGDHELVTKGIAHYDAGVRCPLIVCGAGVVPGVSPRLSCTLDFFPTFCEWAGLERLPPLEGRSFAGACRGEASPGPPEVTVESDHFPEMHPSVRSIVTDDGWRLTLSEGGYGELFDLEADPHEQRNLYWDEAHRAKKLELLERHIRAYLRPLQVQPFGNLPVHNGRRYRTAPGFELLDDVLQLGGETWDCLT